jgi:hypothetical protein
MLKSFSTKQLVFIALMGAAMFVVSFIIGSSLNIALANPIASGLFTAFAQPVFLTIAILTTRRFGVGTSMYLIYGILAIPTNMLGGLPGPFKVVLALSMGLGFDLGVWLLHFRKSGLILGMLITYIVNIPLTFLFYYLLNFPGLDKIIKLAPIMFAVFFIEALLGIWLGLFIYRRIKDKSIVRQLSS